MKPEKWVREVLEDIRIEMRKLEDNNKEDTKEYNYLEGKEEALNWVLRG